MADEYPVDIEEIEGEERLLVTLKGASLPTRGVTVPTEQRSVVVRYPGASAPTTQVMGITEGDITLSGRLIDALTRSGEAIETSDLLRRLVRRRRRCKLQWGVTLVRTGYVTAFRPQLYDAGLIDWELVFQVETAADAFRRPPEPPVRVQNLREEVGRLKTGRQRAQAAALSGLTLAFVGARRLPDAVQRLQALDVAEARVQGLQAVGPTFSVLARRFLNPLTG